MVLTASIFLTVYVEVAVLILLPIYIFITKQGFIFLRRKQDVVFLSIFWVLSMAVTVYWGGTAVDILLGIFMIFAFVAMIFITYTMTQRMFRIILSFVCFMSPYCLLIALIQRALGMRWSYGARYSSVFSNPNYYAFYISLVILFCIYNIVKSDNRRMQLAYAALIPINLIALDLTECRTTYIVLVIVCPVMLFLSGKKKWGAIYLAALAAFAAATLFLGDSLHFLPRVDELAKDVAKRFDIWGGAIGSILDAPVFGRGYNTYVRIRDLYDAYGIAKHSHNLVLRPRRHGRAARLLLDQREQDHPAAPAEQVPPALRADGVRHRLRAAARTARHHDALAADEPAHHVRRGLQHRIRQGAHLRHKPEARDSSRAHAQPEDPAAG